MRLLTLFLLLLVAPAWAGTLGAIKVTSTENATIVKLEVSVTQAPKVFETGAPPRLIIDLAGVDSVRDVQNILSAHVTMAKIIPADGRTRIILDLTRRTQTRMRINKDIIVLAITDAPPIPDGLITNSKTAAELMAQAKSIIEADGSMEDAKEALNGILLMPPNEYSMEAQELIGLCEERAGRIEHARAEYTLYLQLYPTSTEFKRIQQHLISLEIAPPKAIQARASVKEHQEGTEFKFSASLSEYYYTGSTSTKPWSFDQTESTFFTNGRLTSSYRYHDITTKVTIRYAKSNNLIHPSLSKSVLSTATIDWQDVFNDFGVRVGRQTSSYGTLGRFDGVVAGYPLDAGAKSKVLILAGVPYVGTTGTKRSFAGVGVDYNAANYSWTGYANFGKADGHDERKAVGGEVRYFKDGTTGTAIAEYDLLYNTLNTFMVQGTFPLKGTSPYFIIDRRKAPVLFAERSTLLGFGTASSLPFTSVGEAFSKSGLAPNEIYHFISASTPMSESMVFGTSTDLSEKWVLGTDISRTNISATDVGILPILTMPESQLKQPGSGDSYSLNFMLYGNDIWYRSNSFTAILSLVKDKISSMYSLTAVDAFNFGNVRYEILGRFFQRNQERINFGSGMISLRANIKLNESSGLDTAYSLTRSLSVEPLLGTTTASYNQSIYIGYRTDF